MSDTPNISPCKPTNVLAFDFGTRNIGLAIGQTLTDSARPLTVLKAKDGQPNWQELLKHIDDWQPGLLIVGLPLNIDGTESEFCLRARKFARRLRGRSVRKVVMFDERLSTREAKSEAWSSAQMKPGGANSSSRNYNENPVDALAACLILESWLQQPEFAIEP